MYGLVNRAVQDLVLAKHGEPVWAQIRREAGVDVEAFVAMSPYPDEITYALVAAASRVLDVPAAQILEAFGEFWMDFSAEQGYGHLVALLGSDLVSFLTALDGMHERLRLSFPDLDPPSLWCTDVTPDHFVVHYDSDRPGLAPFVVGLLRAAGRRFGQTVEPELVRSRDGGHHHDEFLVRLVGRTEEPDGH